MNFAIGFSLIAAAIVTIALIRLLRSISGNGRNLPVTSEWIEDLSLDRYRPMLRMLDGDDIAFLRSQPGFTPRMAGKLRAQRTQIFSGYLRSLEFDFMRVSSAIKMILVSSTHDRPELAEALLRQQVAFACSMMSVRVRLMLYRWGVCNVDVTRLVELFDWTRLELRTLVPAASMSL